MMKQILGSNILSGFTRRGQPNIVRVADPSEIVYARENPIVERHAPPLIQVERDYIVIGDSYIRTWYVQEWPKALSKMQWNSILNKPGYVMWSLHVQPIPPAIANRQLEREQTALGATLELRQRAKMNYSPVMMDTMDSLIQEQERVGFYGEPLCYLTTTVTISAPSLEVLNQLSTELTVAMQAAGLRFFVAIFEQTKGMYSALPFCLNQLASHRRNVAPATLASLMPSFNEEILMENGLLFGKDVTNGAAITINPFRMQNPNIIIIGIPGAGKSYLLKSLCTQALLQGGTRIFIIDIEGEYRALARDLGGVYLDMTSDSNHRINVLDLDLNSDNPFSDSFHAFTSFMYAVLRREMSPAESRALDEAYVMAFEKKGIVASNPATYTLPAPLLSDLRAALDELREKLADEEPQTARACEVLSNALYSMSDGIYQKEFNVSSNINIGQANFVIFGLKGVAPDILTLRLRQAQIWIANQMLRDLKPKFVIYDEAWVLFRHPEVAMWVESEARRYRKKGGSLCIATQNVGDFTASQYAETIMRLADTRIYMKQNPSSVKELAQIGGLTPEEQSVLTRLNPGEFLLHAGNIRRLCYHGIPPSRHPIYTTKPHEVEALVASNS